MSQDEQSPICRLRADTLESLSPEQSLAILDLTSDGVCLAVPGPWRILHANGPLLKWISPPPGDTGELLLEDVFAELGTPDSLGSLDRLWQGMIDSLSFSTTINTSPGHVLPVRLELRRIEFGDQPMIAIVAQAASPPGEPPLRIDPLTGLADRSFVMQWLTARLVSERAADHHFAVLFIDLDDFKWINDTYGHLMGDRVLCEVARRLSSCVRIGDHVSRFGGDEFVLLVDCATNAEDVEPVIARIRAAFQDRVSLPKGEAKLSVSVGIAVAGPEYQSAEALLEAADRNMYASKGREI